MGEAQQELDLESVAQNCNCETAWIIDMQLTFRENISD